MLSDAQALARAVHAHRDMVILDDVISALDAPTEAVIVHNLIGPKGLFRELGTTVLLITHASMESLSRTTRSLIFLEIQFV